MELSGLEATAFKGKKLPWLKTLIIPIGDIQLQQNRELVDVERLKRVIEYGVDHDAYYIGMGDFIDMESPSNRKALQLSGVYDSVIDALDSKAEELEDELKEILKPTIGKWFGLLQGHHYHVHQDGSTSDMRFANYLKTKFLGDSAFINLPFKNPGKNTYSPSVTIFATHGNRGGKLLSTPLNQLEHITKGFIADIYLVGHHHKALAGKGSRIKAIFPNHTQGVEGRIIDNEFILASTGAFLKGYLQGSQKDGRAGGSYAEKGMMNPLSLGAVKIHLTPEQHHNASPSIYKSVEV
jgi:hypothetical protein